MKKVMLGLGAIAAATVALISPAPAAASCTEVVDGTGCIENVVCGTADRAIGKLPLGRDGFDCVH